MMRANSPGAVMLSATLHAAVVAAAATFALWAAQGSDTTPRSDEFVFVPKEDLNFPGRGEASQNAGPATKPVGFTPSAVPRPTFPLPEEAAPAVVKPVSAPKIGKPTTPVRAAIKPTPSSQPPRPSRPTAIAQPSGPAGSPAIPQIDGDRLAAELVAKGNVSPKHGGPGSPVCGTPGAGSVELGGYFERLMAALRAAHEMPDGVDTLYIARISFFLAADGTLSAVRVVNPSGNADYDRSVLAAFAKVRCIGSVPGGQNSVQEMNFQMVE